MTTWQCARWKLPDGHVEMQNHRQLSDSGGGSDHCWASPSARNVHRHVIVPFLDLLPSRLASLDNFVIAPGLYQEQAILQHRAYSLLGLAHVSSDTVSENIHPDSRQPPLLVLSHRKHAGGQSPPRCEVGEG